MERCILPLRPNSLQTPTHHPPLHTALGVKDCGAVCKTAKG